MHHEYPTLALRWTILIMPQQGCLPFPWYHHSAAALLRHSLGTVQVEQEDCLEVLFSPSSQALHLLHILGQQLPQQGLSVCVGSQPCRGVGVGQEDRVEQGQGGDILRYVVSHSTPYLGRDFKSYNSEDCPQQCFIIVHTHSVLPYVTHYRDMCYV